MRKMQVSVLAGLLAAAGSAGATDIQSQAAELVKGCRVLAAIDDGTADEKYGASDLKSAIAAGYCSGYLNGFIGGYTYGAHGTATKAICVPAGVTVPQMARVLVRRLEEKPQFEHYEQLPYVIGILTLTWPCPKS